MKKSLLNKSVLAAGVLSAAVSANAALGDIKPYVGVGLEHNNYSFNKTLTKPYNFATTIKSIKGNGLGIVAPILGIKFHENFSIEAGYSFNKKISVTLIDENNQEDSGSLKVHSHYLDLIGTIPLADKFELLAGLGIGKLQLKNLDNRTFKLELINAQITPGNFYDVNYNAKFKSRYNWRAKIGAQYNINSNLATRFTFTYQPVNYKYEQAIAITPAGGTTVKVNDNTKIVKNIKAFSLGVVYTF